MSVRVALAALIIILLVSLLLGVPYAGGIKEAYLGEHAAGPWALTALAVILIVVFLRGEWRPE